MSSAFLVLPHQSAAIFNAFSSNLCSLGTMVRYCVLLQLLTVTIIYPVFIELWLSTE